MKRITSIEQLQKGDKIVRVRGGEWNILEFVCQHPHNDKYSLFMNENYDGAPKFYNPKLEDEEWYLYSGSDEDWNEIYDMEIKQLEKRIESIKKRRK